jgi:predicted  nucleic acid-binding Zn-ribbon protein
MFMPAIKCPACGCRHLQAVATCHNCGRPLVAAPDQPISDSEDAPISSSDDGVEASSARDEEVVSEEQERPANPPGALKKMQQLVKAGETRPGGVRRREADIQPYATTLDVTLPDPFADSRSRAIGNVQITDESWKQDKLPWYFLGTRPTLSGIVMHIESKEEVFNNPDIMASLAMVLVEFIWILVNVQQERENDRIVMTTVRIQTSEGLFKDARLRGNMRGADMALGDRVSLWGIRRRGVLFVRHGFNHTAQGMISTNAAGLLLPVVLAVVVFAALLVLTPSWFPAITEIFTTISRVLTFIFQHNSH